MEMILSQIRYFLASFLYGVICFFFYDWLRIFRKLLSHAWVVIALEDILFWLAASIVVFQMILDKNNGILRIFFLVAFGAGMYAYRILAGDRFVIRAEKVIRWLFRPLGWLIRKLKSAGEIILDKWKKLCYHKDPSSPAIKGEAVERMFWRKDYEKKKKI